MFFNSKSIFLTFSDSELKVAVVSGNSKKPHITYITRQSLPAEIVFDGRVVDYKLFKDQVQQFLIKNRVKLKSKRLIVGLNEQDVYVTRVNSTGGKTETQAEIKKNLTEALSYGLNSAAIQYRERYKGAFQVCSVKTDVLKNLAEAIADTGFTLYGFLLLPLSVTSLLNEKDPYIFVLRGEPTLMFTLVVANIVVFSASLKLIKEVKDSEKEILKTIRAIAEFEYEKFKTEGVSLKNIYIAGQEAGLIQKFIENGEFKVKKIDLTTNFKSELGNYLNDYQKCLLIASSFETPFAYLPPFTTKLAETARSNKISPAALFKIAVVIVLIALAVFVGLFVKNNLSAKPQKNEQSVSDALKKLNVATETAKPKVATVTPAPIAPPVVVQPNKQDFKIEILNGTGIANQAKQAKDFLVSKGYNVVATGNAVGTYSQTTLQNKPSKEAIISDLTSDLNERYSIVKGSPLAESAPFDIIIIIGRK